MLKRGCLATSIQVTWDVNFQNAGILCFSGVFDVTKNTKNYLRNIISFFILQKNLQKPYALIAHATHYYSLNSRLAGAIIVSSFVRTIMLIAPNYFIII